ncbi:ABC transporter permease [Pendulispora albinea]|uniref:ABC transporter permease subunit n=1 Tax=Pendulispora albinea TaxID=2741071 RepID=A0ABZ2M8F5_9BACT
MSSIDQVPASSEARRVPALFARLLAEPNAIWMREMRQSARLGRTPWVLFTLTVSISLLMCSIGGIATARDTSPANLGSALFQVFFSLAYLVVVVVGPAVAANSIASEREGRTWEAVLLTGLTPKEITRGKFLAAYTTIALYIVILAPVGALSFLFGGITATEVIIAFFFLFLLAALCVAFGLAVSSLMSSLRGALVVTLILAILIGPAAYAGFGFGCSFAVHELWNDVPVAHPIWLPLAYARVPLGLDYVVLLVAVPLLLVLVPAWYLYETTISNLAGPADDRSSGIKRWFVFCTPLLAVAAAIPSIAATELHTRLIWAIWGLSLFGLHFGFCALLFGAEPPGPSRRVRVHWQREGAGFVRRFFGPGLLKTQVLAVLLGLFGMAFIAGVDALWILRNPGSAAPKEVNNAVEQLTLFAADAMLYAVFVTGVIAWLRARSESAWTARLVACGVLFLVAAGPWVVATIGGALSDSRGQDWLLAGAPSPFYVVVMLQAVDNPPATGIPPMLAGLGCAAAWAAIGILLLGLAARRCRSIVSVHEAALAQADAALAAEDAALTAGDPALAVGEAAS